MTRNLPDAHFAGASLCLAGQSQVPLQRELVELLTDDEIASVCAHELVHLTESRVQHYSRYVVWLMFLPSVLFNPVVHTFGMPGFLALAVGSTIHSFGCRSISHKLEARADQLALAHEPSSGIYARFCRR